MIRIEAQPGTVRLLDDDRPIGHAAWAVTDPVEGLIQLLRLEVDPAHARRGFGRHLLHGLYDHARGQLAPAPLRRVWIAVGNKAHVVARAFLTGEGFHHVGSNAGLYRDQDLLLYVKSFD